MSTHDDEITRLKTPEILEANQSVNLKPTDQPDALLPTSVPPAQAKTTHSPDVTDVQPGAAQGLSSLPLVIPGIIAGAVMMIGAFIFSLPTTPVRIAGAGIFCSSLAMVNIYWCFCLFKLSLKSEPHSPVKKWLHRVVLVAVSSFSTNLLMGSLGLGYTLWYSFMALGSVIILGCHQLGANTTGWIDTATLVSGCTTGFAIFAVFPTLIAVWYYRFFQRVQQPMLAAKSRTVTHARMFSIALALWFPLYLLATVFSPWVVYQFSSYIPAYKAFLFPASVLCVYAGGFIGAFIILRRLLRPLRP